MCFSKVSTNTFFVCQLLIQTVAFGGQLDIIWGPDINFIYGVSGDGHNFIGGFDCGPNADCYVPPVAFNDVTYDVKQVPLDWTNDISVDGLFFVGASHPEGPVRWRAGDSELDMIDSRESEYSDMAYSISADGSIVVGQARERAFIWTPEGGRLRIDGFSRLYSSARGISNDGKVIAGVNTIDRKSQPFRWTEETGVQTLPAVEGFDGGDALNISADGSTIVGISRRDVVIDGKGATGFYWTEDAGTVDIGAIRPIHVSGDGSVIVGEEAIWRDNQISTFPELIRQETGVEIPHAFPAGVSDDGKTIAGTAYDGIGFTSAVILRLGEFEACDLDADGQCNANDIDAMTRIPDDYVRAAYDLNGNERIDFEDRRIWVEEKMKTYFGDANLDGEFNSSDLTVVLKAGRYKQSATSDTSWSDGDFNGDFRFDSGDLVLALSTIAYAQGPKPVAVPEPSAALLMTIGVIATGIRSRRAFND